MNTALERKTFWGHEKAEVRQSVCVCVCVERWCGGWCRGVSVCERGCVRMCVGVESEREMWALRVRREMWALKVPRIRAKRTKEHFSLLVEWRCGCVWSVLMVGVDVGWCYVVWWS